MKMQASDFDDLNPDLILDAVESCGFRVTGEYQQLNSYENRVFDIRVEKNSVLPESCSDRLIAKFYRPQRWTIDAIQDEHDFLRELAAEDIPAIAPLFLDSKSIKQIEKYPMALFPRVLGRNPQEFLKGEMAQVGRLLARIHNVGSRKKAKHRPTLSAEHFGWNILDRLENFVYPELWSKYLKLSEEIFYFLEDELNPQQFIRIHGDCHKGNLLHSGQQFYFVDFDDCINGPEVQDFWMLLSGAGDDLTATKEYDELCNAYEELRKLPDDWYLIEALRGLRIISYASWIAQRWQDPFFKKVFPDFLTYNYWAEEIFQLEQIVRKMETL